MYDFFRRPHLYLVRHGSTDLNAGNCFRSWENPALDDEGLASAQEIANYFSYQKVGPVICSDLQRAMQTAEAVLPFSTCSYPDINPNVRPWGLGSLGGQPKNAKNMKRLQHFIDNPDEMPEGDNAETLNQFRNRWHEVLRAALISSCPECPTVIVGHTSNVTATEELYVENSEKRPETHDIIVPGGILAVYFDENTGAIELVPVLGGVEHEAESEAS